MNTLICGSIAYDSIMLFEDRFKNHIISDQLHNLNVAFWFHTCGESMVDVRVI